MLWLGEVGRLLAELERSQRLELELRRQLKDRERVVEDLQQETEKRVGQIQVGCFEPSILFHGFSFFFILTKAAQNHMPLL